MPIEQAPYIRWRNMTSIYLRCGDMVLMLHREGSRIANGMWIGSAGGHMEPAELNSPESCALRELGEELGIGRAELRNLRLRYVTLLYRAGEVCQNHYFFADIAPELMGGLRSNEGQLQQFSLESACELFSPPDAADMLRHYVSVGQYDNVLYSAFFDGERLQFSPLCDYSRSTAPAGSLTMRRMTGVYLLRGERVLMLRRIGSRVVNDSWIATAGGHMEPPELNDPARCALRELGEETGIAPERIALPALRYITLRVHGDELRQNHYYFAQWPGAESEICASNEGELRWCDLSEALTLPMPVSAGYALRDYAANGRFDTALYGISSNETGMSRTAMRLWNNSR